MAIPAQSSTRALSLLRGCPNSLARSWAMFGAALLAFGAACGGVSDVGGGDHSDPEGSGAEPAPEPDSEPAPARFAGLMHLEGLSALPEHTKAEDPHYSASWRLGAFEDETGLEAFQEAAGVALDEEVDFSRDFVLFAIFDGQTNRLREPRVELDEPAREVALYFHREGIEPHYAEETPVVLHTAPREGVETVRYVAETMPGPAGEREIGVWSPH